MPKGASNVKLIEPPLAEPHERWCERSEIPQSEEFPPTRLKSYCEWFLSDGTVLYGKEAKAHLHSILSNYENLIDHIHFVLKDCLDHCRISRENTLPSLSKKTEKLPD